MATKTIKAWVNGAVQNITVEDMVSPEQDLGVVGISTVTLLSSAWVGGISPYSQVVSISSATKNSMIDLKPNPEQVMTWQDEGWAFSTANDNGTIYVYVSGGKPTEDITVQVQIQEVTAV